MSATSGLGASSSRAPSDDRPSYCLPLHQLSFAEVLGRCESEQNEFDLFELWLDTVTGVTPTDLVALARRYPHRLIAVSNRRPPASTPSNPAPPAALDPAVIELLSGEPLWIDLDHRSQGGALPASPRPPGGARWIVSHHDLERTPSSDELHTLVDRLRATGAELIKIATHCREPRDALRLLELGLHLDDVGCPHVVLGMGRHGAATRILGPLWSSAWVYAPRETNALTAPGQLSRQLLGTFHEALGPRPQ